MAETDDLTLPVIFRVGAFARSLETGWLGKIVTFERDGNGDLMAKMVGVDWLAHAVAGLNADEALNEDDIRWYAPADLIRA